ncbi:diguanylate cyclase domain-containing protein [Atopomonas sediminilitoris]|uniref:diguanylate cyclase domain-containing protein n=1 Tax=Atopomonas sediminilitoris TaxID=2919919 RepID=UPI001F4DACF4|nr:diguanylate cyclase [Atopomonas sediminilitoris]MCJ8169562.1 diguanylate cyclase [Atopomonas sediminilitoris]
MSFSLGIAVPPDMLVIPFEHQNFLLLLAITIAVAAAFVTQSLVEYMIMRLRAGIAQWQLYVSVALAAFCLGAGVWSLHFISLLALQVPIQRSYDVGLTLLSLLLACAAALASLVLLAKTALKHRLLYAGLISGMGILSMHYTGMVSMRSIAVQLHNPWWLLVTVPLAVAVGMLGYFLVERLLRTTQLLSYLALKISISLLLALGVAAVHWVGMHGMQLLVPVDLQAFVQNASSTDTELGLVVGMITLLIMLIGLVGSSWGQQVIRQQSSALSQAALRLQQASDYDPLTGLYNSRAFREKLHQRLSVQADEQPALVLWLDLDQFKRINDSLGHAHGDDLLVQVALRLRAALSGNALLGRYAADEFCVLVNDADLDSLEALPQRLRDQLEPPFSVGDTTLQLSASIGFTYFPDDGREPGELLRDAGIALGWCKKNGRNRSQRFSMTLAGEAQMDLRLEQDLREALDQDGLEVFTNLSCALRMAMLKGLRRWCAGRTPYLA